MSSPILLSGGDDLGHLLHAAQRVVAAAGGQIAIIGGIAVTCRLQRAHRATEDVDAVAAERVPALLDVLSALDGVVVDAANHGRVTVEGVKVDVISVDAIDSVEGLDDKQRLFVLAHRYALDSAEHTRLILEIGQERVVWELPLATPAALVAMKLHSIQDRRGERESKRASDAYDLYRLLADLDADGAIANAIGKAGEILHDVVGDAATTVLLEGATRAARDLHVYGDAAMEAIRADDLAFVGERFVDALARATP